MWFLRKKEDWERAAELQLRECTVQSYIAVNEELLAKSDAKRQKAPHSEGYSVQMNATKRLVTPILILHDTAKAFYAQELEGGGGWPSLWAPSLAVDGISSDYLRLLDATVRDAPVDLLILAAREGPSYLKGGLDEVLAWAKETAEDEYFNPHYRLLARLTGDYLKEAGAIRLPAFRQLIAIVSGAELFHEDGLHPGLIDVLPSLIGRTEELLERRVAFDSVGEESPGPVIKGSGA